MIYEALGHHYQHVHTVEIFKRMDAKEAHELARRRTWRKMAKHPDAAALVAKYRKSGFWISIRPGGCWGNSDLSGR